MGLRINDIVPNFIAETDQGQITFHEWIGDSWAILFSHPKDYTPVCTTEFGAVAQLADENLAVSKQFDMLPADAYLPDGRTAADSASVRSVFIISPDKKVQLIMTYPMSVGRNFAEVLRSLDGLQATFGQPIATPANWTTGQDVIVALTLNDDQAREKFGEIDVKLPYLRTTKHA